MAADNSQLQTAYQQGSANVDQNSFRRGRQKGNLKDETEVLATLVLGKENPPQSRNAATNAYNVDSKHTTNDGSCPALKSDL